MDQYFAPFYNALAMGRDASRAKYDMQQNNALMDMRRQGMDLDKQRFGMEQQQFGAQQEQNALRMQQDQAKMAEMSAFRKAAGELENTPEGHAQLQRRFPMLYKEAGLSSMLPEQPKPITGNFVGADGQYTVYSANPTTGQQQQMRLGAAREQKPAVEVYNGDNLPAGPGNKKFLEKTGELQAQRLNSLIEQAQSGVDRQYGIQTQRATIEQGLKTGSFSPLVNSVASYVEGLGMDPQSMGLPDPAKGQIFDVATFDNLLKALAQQKGPQTEGDAQRALKTFASMKNTVQANMFILDYMDAMTTRQQEMADFVDENAYGKFASSNRPVSLAEKEFRQWASKTPLVATSSKTGVPITYYRYKQAAVENGIPENRIDAEWRKFAGVR